MIHMLKCSAAHWIQNTIQSRGSLPAAHKRQLRRQWTKVTWKKQNSDLVEREPLSPPPWCIAALPFYLSPRRHCQAIDFLQYLEICNWCATKEPNKRKYEGKIICIDVSDGSECAVVTCRFDTRHWNFGSEGLWCAMTTLVIFNWNIVEGPKNQCSEVEACK